MADSWVHRGDGMIRRGIDSSGRRAPDASLVRGFARPIRGEPDIDWLLENQDKVTHYFHQLGLEGKV